MTRAAASREQEDLLRFYQGHLDRVSRSFALCIEQLHSPLRNWISLAYLLCRVLDTIEDSQWPDSDVQTAHYIDFERFMRHRPELGQVEAWAARFPATVPPDEQALLRDAHALFVELHALPAEALLHMQRVVLRMSAGMRHYTAQKQSTGGKLRLADSRDVNRYCYFVAGVVGQLVTELFALAEAPQTARSSLMLNAVHFGLFLQKVNLLKDQLADEAEGRFLVPNRSALLGTLRPHAEAALDYIVALPLEAQAYRTFCGWSRFLGAASLPQIEASYRGEGVPKLPRAQTLALLQHVGDLVQNNDILRQTFADYAEQLPAASAAAPSPSDAALPPPTADWFWQGVGDGLPFEAGMALGMV